MLYHIKTRSLRRLALVTVGPFLVVGQVAIDLSVALAQSVKDVAHDVANIWTME